MLTVQALLSDAPRQDAQRWYRPTEPRASSQPYDVPFSADGRHL